ncbi:Splicing factor YJU2 [Camellia lanceoleosa]|uniref:Splicing factor YJU2 n=1 Tax=Camellia lanceoleosa TaxID=1840588 RepID=A0ACC0G7R0_9ERIC|nr:Splicing factor YJU2 [Camellia lanceoleosa]
MGERKVLNKYYPSDFDLANIPRRRFYFKCTKCSAELTIKTDPQNSDYVVESGASRNFEPWHAKDEEADKEKQKRETEEMGDAMKSLENRTLDSKREMDILAALDEVKSMREKKLEEEDEALIKSLFGAPREVIRRIDDDILDDDEDLSQISTDNAETSSNNSKRRKVSEELPTNRFLKNFPLSQQII